MEQKKPSTKASEFLRLILIVVAVIISSYAIKEFRDYLTTPVISPEQASKMFKELGGKEGEVPVILFMTSWCPACKATEALFKKENVPFIEADIEENPLAGKFFHELSQGKQIGIPQTVIGNTVFSGYTPFALLKAYADEKDKL